MTPSFPVLYLNIGLHRAPVNGKDIPAALTASNTLYEVASAFSRVYSCEILPGKDEPTLVLAVSPMRDWKAVIEAIARALGQDSIACLATDTYECALLGPNTARLTWDNSKFIKPRVFFCMAE